MLYFLLIIQMYVKTSPKIIIVSLCCAIAIAFLRRCVPLQYNNLVNSFSRELQWFMRQRKRRSSMQKLAFMHFTFMAYYIFCVNWSFYFYYYPNKWEKLKICNLPRGHTTDFNSVVRIIQRQKLNEEVLSFAVYGSHSASGSLPRFLVWAQRGSSQMHAQELLTVLLHKGTLQWVGHQQHC